MFGAVGCLAVRLISGCRLQIAGVETTTPDEMAAVGAELLAASGAASAEAIAFQK